MQYVSTRGEDPTSLRTALYAGLAPDGGLYLPRALTPRPPATWRDPALGTRPAAAAHAILGDFLGPELDPAAGTHLLAEAFSFPIPLRRLDESTRLLELFHGPTLAFKDVGARTLARLLSALPPDGGGVTTVLVATSGDTGGAVAAAFHRVPRTRVVVLYPAGRVSPRQERQFATLGDNVHALAVAGAFDDCQRLVKGALEDPALAGAGLTSANSINIGRLLPQMAYYVHGWAQLAPEERARAVFVVPSGNFGNLAAGLLAHRLGLPARGFVAATNANDVVPAYLRSGRFEPRASVPTVANAMDVGNPSNLERIRALYGDDLEALRRDVRATTHADPEIRRAIRSVSAEAQQTLDPHTAIGWLAWQEVRRHYPPDSIGVLLATAHPAKFAETVEPLIGRQLPLPPSLAAAMERPLQSVAMPASASALASYLLELS